MDSHREKVAVQDCFLEQHFTINVIQLATQQAQLAIYSNSVQQLNAGHLGEKRILIANRRKVFTLRQN
jgi:hypothetical protein